MAKKKKRKGKSKGSRDLQVLGICGVFMAVAFLPTTIFLFLGMMPTIAAAAIDRSAGHVKALTVGSMNLAGCSPFLLELWSSEHTVGQAVVSIADPRTIIVVYCAAGIGYLIDWAMGGIVATLMTHKAEQRLKEITRIQAELVERWGREVTGEIPLDPYGFPLESADPEKRQVGRA